MIKLSLKGFAEYMTSNASQQRKILRDYKFPDPEGRAQAMYYREATNFIKTFHDKSYSPSWLQSKADDLKHFALVSTGQTKIRLEHNYHALESYIKHFGKKVFKVNNNPRFNFSHGDVTVNVYPDLCVEEKGIMKLIKLEYSKNVPEPRLIKIITQTIYDAASTSFPKLKSSNVLYFDVTRGNIYKGARLGSRIKKEIQDACTNIEALWPTIK